MCIFLVKGAKPKVAPLAFPLVSIMSPERMLDKNLPWVIGRLKYLETLSKIIQDRIEYSNKKRSTNKQREMEIFITRENRTGQREMEICSTKRSTTGQRETGENIMQEIESKVNGFEDDTLDEEDFEIVEIEEAEFLELEANSRIEERNTNTPLGFYLNY